MVEPEEEEVVEWMGKTKLFKVVIAPDGQMTLIPILDQEEKKDPPGKEDPLW